MEKVQQAAATVSKAFRMAQWLGIKRDAERWSEFKKAQKILLPMSKRIR